MSRVLGWMDCSAVGLSDAAIQKKAPTVCRGFKGREKAQRESLGTEDSPNPESYNQKRVESHGYSL